VEEPPEDRYGEEWLSLSAEQTESLQATARENQLTINTIVQGAWGMLLSRYSGELDVVYGVVVSGRPSELEGVEKMVGLFINTLPLRIRILGGERVVDWLKALQQEAVEMRQYEYSPLVEIQGWSGIGNGEPLFESILVYENYPVDESLHQQATQNKSLKIKESRIKDYTNYPITISAGLSKILWLQLIYDIKKYDPASIKRIPEQLLLILKEIVRNPNQRLQEIGLLTDGEIQQILYGWNQTVYDCPRDFVVYDLFEAAVKAHGESTAVIDGDRRISYQELDLRARQLANYLKILGVGRETIVGIYLEPSIEQIISIFATLKAGAAYLPIDTATPKERAAYLMEDAGARLLLTRGRFEPDFHAPGVQKISLDTAWEKIANQRGGDETQPVSAGNLAYVIYTSGSTGKPKGVMVEHRSLASYSRTVIETFGLGPGDRVLQFASISFDMSVEEIFPCLLSGATLVLRNEEMLRSASCFLTCCQQWNITTLMLPTVYWHELASGLEIEGLDIYPGLRVVYFGGDLALFDRLLAWRKRIGRQVQLINSYGPTETTVTATMCELGNNRDIVEARSASIGRAIKNTQVYLLDLDLELAPVGAIGELYIGGVGVARGYLHAPAITAEKYLPNPFGLEPGARLYRTGDQGRYLAGGEIEFIGRVDQQVKVLGRRIELGEIKAALLEHESVGECEVIDREDRLGEKYLVAYFTTAPGSGATAEELRRYLEERLPRYMVPAAFIPLEKLPTTPSGKVNRRSLPTLAEYSASHQKLTIEPRDAIELQLVQLWEDVLGRSPIGVRDNFFDLGGHSLSAMKLMSGIEKCFGRSLPLSSLIAGGTIEQFAAVLRQQVNPTPQSPIVCLQSKGTNPPFFCIHPAGGNILCYIPLSRSLGDQQPFYGLQSPALYAGGESFANLEAMASAYIRAIQKVQKKGPYFIGGWSSGGVIAYEIARQLMDAGEMVALLAIIDVGVPELREEAPDYQAPSDMQLLANVFLNLYDIPAHIKNLDPYEQLDFLIDLGKKHNFITPDFDPDHAMRYVRVFKENSKATDLYLRRPSPYRGKVTLFRAVDPLEQPSDPPKDPAYGWEKWAQGGVEIHTAPGSHKSILEAEEGIQKVASILSQCIRKAVLDEGYRSSFTENASRG
jgi:amino acid adenylation domain-containing protein